MSTRVIKDFNLLELSPKIKILNNIDKIDNLDIKQLLKTINKRIETMYNRDHIVGHVYFMSLINKSGLEAKIELANIFEKKIIPLLKHYFKNDWEKIRIVLGDTLKEEKYQFIKERESLNLQDLIEDEQKYEINYPAFFNILTYKKIYE